MSNTDNNVDDLFDIKNSFYLGKYQQCISESQQLKSVDPDVKLERDVFMYRAYLCLRRFGVVLDEVRSSANASSELSAVYRLAEYLSSTSQREAIVSSLEKSMTGNVDVNNSTFLVTAATIFMHEDNNEAALRLLHQSDALECMFLSVQLLLRLHRVDLARKELARLQATDEDATVTQLALALVNLSLGGADKLQEAYFIYQELADKYGATPLLLNGQAVCLMAQGKWEDAEPLLQEAQDKDNNCAETLVNSVVLSQHLGKPAEVTARYVSQLKESHGQHPWVRELVTKEAEFDRLCLSYGEE